MSSSALIIFVKNPVPGRVKTRLAATVGDQEAMRIYLALCARTRDICLGIDADRYLYYSDFIDPHDAWSNAAFHKRCQVDGDLGQRMESALQEVLAHHQQAVLVGTDCPLLSATILQESLDQLTTYDAILGPATDGGYYLLGLRQVIPTIFRDMTWSTDQVLADTVVRLTEAGATYHTVATLPDIDFATDWEQYGWPLE